MNPTYISINLNMIYLAFAFC